VEDRNGNPMDAANKWARDKAIDVLQSISDNEPDEDTSEAQDILAGTPYESMYLVNGRVIEEAVYRALSDAYTMGSFTLTEPEALTFLERFDAEHGSPYA
jgi:hypothetical protein